MEVQTQTRQGDLQRVAAPAHVGLDVDIAIGAVRACGQSEVADVAACVQPGAIQAQLGGP